VLMVASVVSNAAIFAFRLSPALICLSCFVFILGPDVYSSDFNYLI
jgi:hypothetical protein